jgi:hypothetical protein
VILRGPSSPRPSELRALSERAELIERIVVGMIGLAWSLACYLVVSVLAFQDLSPGSAL